MQTDGQLIMGHILKGLRGKAILKGKGWQKNVDICYSTRDNLWFNYPQYTISIAAKELRNYEQVKKK